MVDNNWLGSKSGQGFYKKEKDADGKRKILALDLKTLEYHPSKKVKFPTLEMTKPIDDLRQRTKMLLMGQDKAGDFIEKLLLAFSHMYRIDYRNFRRFI